MATRQDWEEDALRVVLADAEALSERFEREMVQRYLSGVDPGSDRGYYGKQRAADEILSALYRKFEEDLANWDRAGGDG
ncbi:MAG: hypothetical protein KIS66_02265 [Fimbriimonadaceae bacterium]|nr:hypothetical protein [Fimbriimonadaceae bacterium]